MTLKNVRYGDVIYISLWLLLAITFTAANKIPVKKYTPYQLLVWEIKANEGYRSWWYKDGKTIDGRQRYSIGFGWNDLGGIRRHEIAKYTKDRHVSYSEAMEITLLEIKKKGTFNSDPYRNLAMQLYSYNCGTIKSASQLGRCHGGAKIRGKRCGHPSAKVRIAHNRRREYELALWNHDWVLIQQYTEENRKKVSNQIIKYK